MSMSPQQIQQMLAQYKSQFGGASPLSGFDAAQQSLGAGAPAGTNRTAGAVNGVSQLMVALLRAQKQKQLQQQLQNQQQQATPVPSQGASLSAPSDASAAGMGVPDGGGGAGT
jgi:hypothetical protein